MTDLTTTPLTSRQLAQAADCQDAAGHAFLELLHHNLAGAAESILSAPSPALAVVMTISRIIYADVADPGYRYPWENSCLILTTALLPTLDR